mmetsp:Transcript_16538/g.40736  ORF Transcript_16538/g.40736 Transcript_16538/m.40736 type:complete len:244 (+) Transcript_16538:26-757(+)
MDPSDDDICACGRWKANLRLLCQCTADLIRPKEFAEVLIILMGTTVGILNAIINDLSEKQQDGARASTIALGFFIAGLKTYEKNGRKSVKVSHLNALEQKNNLEEVNNMEEVKPTKSHAKSMTTPGNDEPDTCACSRWQANIRLFCQCAANLIKPDEFAQVLIILMGMVVGILNTIATSELSKKQEDEIRATNIALGFLIAGLKTYEKNHKTNQQLQRMEKNSEKMKGQKSRYNEVKIAVSNE